MMKKGFTLVELLIVIIIIGILATMAVPQYQKMVDRARRSEAISMLGSLATGSLLYWQEHNAFPTTITIANLDITLGTSSTWTYAAGTHVKDTTAIWKATRIGTTSWIVRVTVTLATAAKLYEESKDSGATWTELKL